MNVSAKAPKTATRSLPQCRQNLYCYLRHDVVGVSMERVRDNTSCPGTPFGPADCRDDYSSPSQIIAGGIIWRIAAGDKRLETYDPTPIPPSGEYLLLNGTQRARTPATGIVHLTPVWSSPPWPAPFIAGLQRFATIIVAVSASVDIHLEPPRYAQSSRPTPLFRCRLQRSTWARNMPLHMILLRGMPARLDCFQAAPPALSVTLVGKWAASQSSTISTAANYP
ncbi:hypothetical protein C8R47DRAFT_1196344 [Mycena vitilis]|nr:hypothetical protein C8R47DRAFT_1196344 [Mycena vitilis]